MQDLNVSFSYKFSSVLGPMYYDRYVKDIFVIIESSDDSGEFIEKIGEAHLKLIYLDNAENDGQNLYDIFDCSEYTMRCAEKFFNFKTHEFKAAINKHYNDEFLSKNVCLLQRLEILPKYRGLNFGPKLIKDIVFHFGSACALFIVQPYPLQFEANLKEDDWQTSLQLNKFENDQKKAFKKLTAYYERCGFEKVKGINDLLFCNPLRRNKYLDAIDLEE